jgi:heptosyltransferase-2
VKRFVAIGFGALGDFLLTLPLLRELRARGTVALIARAAYRALLPDWLGDATFLPVDGPTGGQLFAPGGALSPALRELVDGADIHVFARTDDLLTANLERHAAKSIVWHDPRPTAPPHIVARYFAEAHLPLPDGWLGTPAMPVDTAGDALWIHAGSGSPGKSLPLPFLADRAADWHQSTGQSVLVSFGEADLALQEPLAGAFGRRGVPYAEAVCPTLAELRRQLGERARLYLGADTGVTHLAAALGRRTVVGFRSTDPAIWRPLGDCHVLQAEHGAAWMQALG